MNRQEADALVMRADRWVTLPEYPTTAMFFAATQTRLKNGVGVTFGEFLREYRAMLDAAPSAAPDAAADKCPHGIHGWRFCSICNSD